MAECILRARVIHWVVDPHLLGYVSSSDVVRESSVWPGRSRWKGLETHAESACSQRLEIKYEAPKFMSAPNENVQRPAGPCGTARDRADDGGAPASLLAVGPTHKARGPGPGAQAPGPAPIHAVRWAHPTPRHSMCSTCATV